MSSTGHWRNSPTCSGESRTRPWSMHSWLDCQPIPRSCCVHLPILTTSRLKVYSAEQGPLWTLKGLLPLSTDQPQNICLYPNPQRTHCIVLTALGPIIWLSTASLNDRGSAVSQPSNVTDARRRTMSRQNVQKTETRARCEHHSRLGKNGNQPASDACVCINGVMRDALIDSGCTQSLVRSSVCGPLSGHKTEVLTIDRKSMTSRGVTSVNLLVDKPTPVVADTLAMDGDLSGFDLLLGFDVIRLLGGVHINEHGEANFPNEVFSVGTADAVKIERPDFDVIFDPAEKKWIATWKWLGEWPPKQLINQTPEYTVPEHVQKDYNCELQIWIHNGRLIPYLEKELGPLSGLFLLMAIVQHNKGKVLPVMNYCELNDHVETYTTRADVYSQKLRDWYWKGSDIRKAYFQVHVHRSLWPFQTMMVKGQRYCLTRMGFGLNINPSIMQAIVETVLSNDITVRQAMSAYIDNIFINNSVAPAERVKQHFL